MKELLLALPAGRSTQGAHFGLTPAHMAYRVGPGLRLLGQRLPDGLRGGLMLLSCAGLEGGELHKALGRSLRGEMSVNN